MAENEVQTAPSRLQGSFASRLVAVVVTALVYGALVYISKLTPHLLGQIQIIYPASAVPPAFGVWFGFWGGLGTILGTTLVQLPTGLNPLVWIPANLAQAIPAWLPALLYRKVTVGSAWDWLRFAAICLVASAAVSLLLVANLALQGVPLAVGMKTVFGPTLVDDFLWMVIVGPLIMNVVSPYVIKAGLRFTRFF